jgi:thymidylate synthase
VSGWDPGSCQEVDLPPCHTLFHFKVERGQVLHCQLYQRSADAFLGVPFNIASYALLTRLVAHVCDLTPGEFIHTFGDLHLYKNHLDQARIQLARNPFLRPRLTLDENLRGKGLSGLLAAKWSHIKLSDYKHHPKIQADVAV